MKNKVRFGQYEIKNKIASGGMGSIFRAKNLNTNKIVAIKFLKPSIILDNKQFKDFEQEATILKEMHNPNIITIYDFCQYDDLTFIVMDFETGLNLRTFLEYNKRKGRKIPVKLALKIFEQACNAIEEVHKNGFIHLDIKPENFVISRMTLRHRVKLIDFGISRPHKIVQEEKEIIERSINDIAENLHELWGTPSYMSPEQIIGDSIDYRSDIYSLGVLLYELLTGELPFQGNTLEVLEKHLYSSPIPIDRFRGDIPYDLSKLVSIALRKDKHNRFKNITDMKEFFGVKSTESPDIYYYFFRFLMVTEGTILSHAFTISSKSLLPLFIFFILILLAILINIPNIDIPNVELTFIILCFVLNIIVFLSMPERSNIMPWLYITKSIEFGKWSEISIEKEIENLKYQTYISRGNFLEKENKFEDALMWYSKALRIRPYEHELKSIIEKTKYRSLISRTNILIKADSISEAIVILQEAVRINPDMPDAFVLLGKIYLEQNNPQQALSVLKTASEIDPNSKIIKELINQAFMSL